MSAIYEQLIARLNTLEKENKLRSLSLQKGIDFSSNDYLGLANSALLKQSINEELMQLPLYKNGAVGSRLLFGNSAYAEELEQYIAIFHEAEAGLIYNSGYDANIGLLSCVANRHDTYIYDELVHASIIDGMKLSWAKNYKFKHNDLIDLEKKLNAVKSGNIFIVVESVYSMDGDFALLNEISILAKKYHANLIVDEAHATGLFGNKGQGYVSELKLENACFARICTFGKALGVHGAIVLGTNVLRKYLINHSRSFIYSTALPIHSLVAIKCAYKIMENAHEERFYLKQLIAYFKLKINETLVLSLNSTSAIQGVVIAGNNEVKESAKLLQNAGFDVKAILSPTVKKGMERIRICIHAFNTKEEIDNMCMVLGNKK